jgi:hypothetical protein
MDLPLTLAHRINENDEEGISKNKHKVVTPDQSNSSDSRYDFS